MVKLNHKIQGFTIMESMVALVIVMIVFSLSSIVVINVVSSGMSREKQNAYMLVKAMRNETFAENRYIDEVLEENEITVEKTITEHSSSNTLKVLLIVASNKKKKLFESRELILIPEEL